MYVEFYDKCIWVISQQADLGNYLTETAQL